MIVELLNKEYKENFLSSSSSSLFKKILKSLFKILFLGIFIALEVYIFFALDKKIIEFSKFGSLDFLILFLVILLLFSTFSSLIKARNVFYKRSDSQVLLHLPLNNEEVIFSKTLFIYLYSVFINFVISVPLLISFGVNRGVSENITPSFYILSLLYPFFVSLFSSGITLCLLPLYNKVYIFLKDKPLIQIILGSILVVSLCFVYQFILNLFINLINNTKFDSLFSEDFLTSLNKITPYLFPVSGLVKITHIKENLISNLLISIGVSLGVNVIGFIITSISYTSFLKKEFSNNKSVKISHNLKVESSFKALLKKEFVLIFRNSNYIFSYTSLLIMQPFLAFVVISSLNSLLYTNMNMVLIYFPELINGLNILLLLLFSSIISSSSMDCFTREDKSRQIVKYLPINNVYQSYIKLIIPLIFSISSLLLTNIILVSFSKISVLCFFVSTFLGILLQFSLSFIGIYIDLIKLDESKNKNIEFLSTLVSVFLPLFLFLIHLLMTYFSLNVGLMYFIEIFIFILILIVLVIPFKKIITKYFIRMKV